MYVEAELKHAKLNIAGCGGKSFCFGRGEAWHSP